MKILRPSVFVTRASNTNSVTAVASVCDNESERAGRAGISGQRLRHPEHLIERGGDDAAMDVSRRALIGDAEVRMPYYFVAGHCGSRIGGASELASPMSGL